jgi:hypothetical protein
VIIGVLKVMIELHEPGVHEGAEAMGSLGIPRMIARGKDGHANCMTNTAEEMLALRAFERQ